tara:strand:- start:548 stop:958 length:411 start_codon:yes stop_codon:yes gene_type:complete
MEMTQEMVMSSFQMGRLIDAMSFIGTIIAIWLALRIANMSGENPDSNLISKILSTGFGLCVMAGSFMQFTFAANTWIFAARNTEEIMDKVANPERAQAFIDYVGTTTTATTPTPLGIAFLAIITIMIVTLIWVPRK